MPRPLRALLLAAPLVLLGACGTGDAVVSPVAPETATRPLGPAPSSTSVTPALPPTSSTTVAPTTTLAPTTTPPPTTTLPATTLPATTLPATTTTVRPRSPQLLLVGDSVMKAVELYGNPAEKVLGPMGWQVQVDAEESRFPDAGIRVLAKRRPEIGDVVVIQLSNNYGGDQDRWRAQVAEMLRVLDGVPEVWFLTVSEFRPDRREVNDVLREVAANDPRVRVIDWNAVASTTPGLLARDKLHLTPTGAKAMAELIGQAIGRP